MNIEALLKSAMSNITLREPKALNLQAGQWIQGVLLKILTDGEALIDLSGVQVRAQLETPMQPGQSTWLQVQPQSAPDRIRLKVMSNQEPEQGWHELFTKMALKDSSENRHMIQFLMDNGLPIEKQNVARFSALMKSIGSSPESFAALKMALKQGWPLTPGLISILKQGMEEASTAQLWQGINQLSDQINEYIGSSVRVPNLAVSHIAELSQSTKELFQLFSTKWEAGKQLLSSLWDLKNSPTPLRAENVNIADAEGPPLDKNGHQPNPATQSRVTHISNDRGPNELIPVPQTPDEVMEVRERTNNQKELGSQSAQPQKHEPIPRQLLRWLGYLEPSGKSFTQPDAPRQNESIKALLTQIINQPDVPIAIKEQAQVLTQQISGQQLASFPQQDAQFTQVSLAFPILQQEGRQVHVHIQSRKGNEKQIDRSHCRLLFHLEMEHLGETWVDVSIFGQRLAVKVMSDCPTISSLVQSNSSLFKKRLSELGYALDEVGTDSLPKKNAMENTNNGRPLSKTSPYKGVNLRI